MQYSAFPSLLNQFSDEHFQNKKALLKQEGKDVTLKRSAMLLLDKKYECHCEAGTFHCV